MKRDTDIDVIRQGLIDRAEDLCRQLLPSGRFEGGRSRYMAHDPVAGDYKKAPALSVALGGAKRGRWRNFRGTAGPAKHDLIGLIAYVHQTDTKGALAWARDFLGLEKLDRDTMVRLRHDAQTRAAERERQAARRRAGRIRQAERLFTDGTVPLIGGGAIAEHVLAYLMARECPAEQVATLAADSFRAHGASEWWRGAQWADRRKVSAGPRYPALHSALRGPTGVVTACHVTFLDPLAPQKAPVSPPKLVFGEQAGAVIEIATGDGAPFWTATRAAPVVLCEGIETGLSLALALATSRIWAAGSISNLGNAPIELACVSGVVVARDNNAGNAQAQDQLEAQLTRLERAGKPVSVMASPVGDDFNDLMEGEFL